MITVSGLTKRYGRRNALSGLSLQANPGEVTLLIVSNGAGKTTTLRILAGSIRPDGGEATIEGVDVVKDRRQAQRKLALLPQEVAFDSRLNCRQLLRFYARVRGVKVARVDEMLSTVGLEAEAAKRAGDLSGGLRQRLGLAVLLLPDAPVLLLDEPGLSLDPKWRAWMQDTLRREAASGKTVLVATHLLGEWEGVANRCLRCRDGSVVGEVDPARLRDEVDGWTGEQE